MEKGFQFFCYWLYERMNLEEASQAMGGLSDNKSLFLTELTA